MVGARSGWMGIAIVCCFSMSEVWSDTLPSSAPDATTVATSEGAESIEKILKNVAQAIRESSYRGRITYEQSGKLEVMEISHGVINGVEHEKVDYLNGPSRVMAKSGGKAECETRGGHLLSGGIIPLPNGKSTELRSSYRMTILGEDRVAGRDAWVLQMFPMDEFRHGMIFAIDKSSFLPLKTMYVANGRKVLERLHFVSLETNVNFNESDFSDVESQAVVHPNATCSSISKLIQGSVWKPSWVPPGFVLSEYSYTSEDGYIETYTDGLASFSIFVKPIDNPHALTATQMLNTNLKRGATVIVMRMLGDKSPKVHASILGEIPPQVAGRIISSVNYASP